MQYKIGDTVSFLNEKGMGRITNILSNFRVLVLNEDGFEVSIPVDQLVPASDTADYKVDSKMTARWFDEKESKEIEPPRLEGDEVWEVDLHLHELVDSGRFITDHEKLTHQLKYFKKCMEAAQSHRVKKVIFIHGIGKGTLKQEIIHALKDYARVRFYDAPYKKYGFGATTVEIF